MNSKKGFISFILFFILSFSLISLSISTTIPNPSLSPAYDYKLTYQNHIHLKRSFPPAAQSAISNLNIQPTHPLKTQLKYELIRFQILQEFSSLTFDYSNNSQFEFKYYCKYSNLTSLIFPSNPQFPQTPSNLLIWNECAQNIEIYEDLNKTKVTLNGFYLKTTNKITNTNIDSLIESFEVN